MPSSNRTTADAVATTTCYMCACRCGIRVYLKDGTVRYIEGNPKHPVNKGVLCAKGSAGIMQHYSPARLSKPLLRVGARGSGEFKEIEWDEVLDIAAEWLGDIRRTDPKRLAFFTGRDQSQSLTAWWAQQFGTFNYAAHGGFCSVNMAAAGLYSIGGAFWEFGEPDWDLTRYFLMFGVAEDHDSNPIKAGLGKLKTRGEAKFVSVNPVRTGYSAIADEWVGIKPGTDGLFVSALIHELLKAEKIDWDYLARYTNASWLVIQQSGAADHGLFARDPETTAPLCFDKITNAIVASNNPDVHPAMIGRYDSDDGRELVTAFQLMVERYLDERYAPAAVAEQTGVGAEQIQRIAAELAEAAFEQEVVIDVPWTDWTGKTHAQMIGRPVAMHAMRGVSAHANGFHTCRAIHLLQMLLGSIDVPGGFRYKPPFPKHIPPPLKPARPAAATATPLMGPPLGFPASPDDLLVDEHGQAQRIDKAFSWEFPLAIHGMMHMVIHNAWKGDPYPIDTLFMYMTNMAWNSSMNTTKTIGYLTDKDPASGEYKIPHIIYSDAYYSETVAYADLVLPDTTYLERWDCISLLDRPIGDADGPADSIRQPVVAPDRDVRCFQEVLLKLGAKLGLPGMVNADGSETYPGGYADYITNHMRSATVGPLAGWRGTNGEQSINGEANPDQLDRYVENGCFWREEFAPTQRYYKFANQAYLDYAKAAGWIGQAKPIVMQIYSEALQKFRLAADGHGDILPPPAERQRIRDYFDPLPFWYDSLGEQTPAEEQRYRIHALTQRPMHMYHSWGGQNAWLRQLTASNELYIHHALAQRLQIDNGDWVTVSSPHGKIKAQIKCMSGVNEDTVWTWNAIAKRAGTWGLSEGAPEVRKGFLLNHIISELLPPREDGYQYANADPVTGQAAWFDLKVAIEKCAPQLDTASLNELPKISDRDRPPAPTILRFGESIATNTALAQAGTHYEFVGNEQETIRSVTATGPLESDGSGD